MRADKDRRRELPSMLQQIDEQLDPFSGNQEERPLALGEREAARGPA